MTRGINTRIFKNNSRLKKGTHNVNWNQYPKRKKLIKEHIE
jgi:hypothetical protein